MDTGTDHHVDNRRKDHAGDRSILLSRYPHPTSPMPDRYVGGDVIAGQERDVEVEALAAQRMGTSHVSKNMRIDIPQVPQPNFRFLGNLLRELHAKRPDLEIGYLVVVVDEYADLVTVLCGSERADFEKQVLRLTQRARAVGIHLIIATQRPSTDFVTGAVKANLPTRISFRLPQRTDSMVILDQPGAERLLGAGDMLLWREGRVQRLQGYFASTEEIARLLTDRIAELKGPRTHE